MSFTAWVQAHRRSILFVLTILAVGGAASALKLPVALFPHVNFPVVRITVDAGERPAEQMELQVTQPIERAVRSIPNIVTIRSISSRGSAEIRVSFAWGTDTVTSLLQIESVLSALEPRLPRGTTFETTRLTPAVFPVAAYSLTSPTHSLVEMTDIARYRLIPALAGIRGVAQVTIDGAVNAEYQVTIDPARLDAFGLTIEDVAKALSASNVITAVGRLEDRYKLDLVVSDTRFHNLDEILKTVLRSGETGQVELDDVAKVAEGTEPRIEDVTADGRPAVLVQVFQQPDGNTVQIVKDVGARLDSFRARLPPGITLSNWYNQSTLIVSSAQSVETAILLGIAMAAVVLFLFLRNLRITLIAIVVVPAALASAVLLLFVLGMSFNIMTLGGMAAAVGLIIDDAIVMTEQLVRRLRDGANAGHAARLWAAAREFTPPLAGSSMSTIVVFLPLSFLGGVTGDFFKALAFTMGSSLVFSFFMAWLAVPILADHLLGPRDAAAEEGGRLTAALHRRYTWIMERTLRRPALVLLGVVPLIALGYFAYVNVGTGFMPEMDEGGFNIDYHAPPGTSLTETARLARQIEAILRANPAVTSYSRRTGAVFAVGLAEANEGDFIVELKPFPRASVQDVMDQVREQIHALIPQVRVEFAQLMGDLIADLISVPQPIEIKLYGDEPDALVRLAPKVAEAIGNIDGVVDVADGVVIAGDSLDVHIDRVRAAFEGIDPEAVTVQLTDHLAGARTTEVVRGVKIIGVRVWSGASLRRTPAEIDAIRIRAPDGHWFPLSRVATLQTIKGQPQITRENLRRMIAVTARISGRDLGSTIADVQSVLKTPGLVPQGIQYELGGIYREQQSAFLGLAVVFAGAVALVSLLLLILYERFRVVVAIMTMPLLAVAAVFIGLWATGTELNVTSMMGMTMIVGIVTEVAIFYFSEFFGIGGVDAQRIDALIAAGRNRMRAIAMTTLAAILALLPLALGIGSGSAMQQPLAIAIISGLLVQLPLVLLVMPALYHAISRRRVPPEQG